MDTESVRQAFKSLDTEILFIGESPPASGVFFYVQSNMTRYTKEAFEQAFGARFDDTKDFLWFFRACGCYLDDLSLEPVIQLGPKERGAELLDAVPGLAERIREAAPEVIIVVLKKIAPQVKAAMALAAINAPTYVLPFPGQGGRVARSRAIRQGTLGCELRRSPVIAAQSSSGRCGSTCDPGAAPTWSSGSCAAGATDRGWRFACGATR
jgi:hypothetical protein